MMKIFNSAQIGKLSTFGSKKKSQGPLILQKIQYNLIGTTGPMIQYCTSGTNATLQLDRFIKNFEMCPSTLKK